MTTIKPSPSKSSNIPIIISHESIEILLKNKASATQICAYIVIASRRDFGTSNVRCGYDAISKCVGIGFEKAKKVVDELLTYQLKGSFLLGEAPTRYEHWVQCVLDCPVIYDRADENGSLKRLEYLEQNKQELQRPKKTEIRWKGVDLNVCSSIWLQRVFVGDKLSDIKPPVHDLNRRKNDVAARLLLIMYAWNDLVLDGVAKSPACIMNECYTRSGIGLYIGTAHKIVLHENMIKWAFGLNELPDKSDTQKLWKHVTEALDMLEKEKFISKVVVVDIWDAERKERQCCYDLHAKGERKKGSLSERIRIVAAENLEHLDTRADGRSHDGNYYAVAPEGSRVEIMMVYRLSHVAWAGGSSRVHDIREGHGEQVLEWLRHIEKC
jgi:hypothetical protein